MQKNKLVVENKDDLKESFFLGINSELPAYRIAYYLGKPMDSSLKPSTVDGFECYQGNGLHNSHLLLLKNKKANGMIAPKLKMADFILVVKSSCLQKIVDIIKSELAQVKQVQTTFVIEEKYLPKSKLKYFA